MLTTISEKVTFSNVEPSVLYNLYMNAEQHAASTGAPADIREEIGASFSLYGGYCFGKNLHLEPNSLIVQTWKAANWPASQNTVLTLRFEADGGDTHVYLSQANLPAEEAASIEKGWSEWYWDKWRAHLEGH